jgi:flagellar hook-length control protein FliK
MHDAAQTAREIAHAVQTHLVKVARPPASTPDRQAIDAPVPRVAAAPAPAVTEPPSVVSDTPSVAAERREVPLAAMTLADLAPRFKAMMLPLPLTATTTGVVTRTLPDLETSTESGGNGRQGLGRGPELAVSVSKRLAETVHTVTAFESMLGSQNQPSPVDYPTRVENTPSLPNAPAVMSSIVQTMRLQYRDGVGTAVINLDPGFLGGVAISLHVANGAVTATLQADNPQVRAWLEANEPMLRQGLEAQGLTLDRLVVAKEQARDWNTPDEQRRQPQQQQEEKPRPRRAETATFEVIV